MLNHSADILHYVGVRHPHNPEALPCQPSGTAPIIIHLKGMGLAIDLDHQLCLSTEEISDERAQPDLAAELEAGELAGAQAGPESALSRRGFPARGAYTIQAIRLVDVGTSHPLTFPSLSRWAPSSPLQGEESSRRLQ